jgi:anti-sigma factor RsiW
MYGEANAPFLGKFQKKYGNFWRRRAVFCAMQVYGHMERETITDLEIQALVDGELDQARQKQVMDALDRRPDLYKRYLQYKKQKSLLRAWWKDN